MNFESLPLEENKRVCLRLRDAREKQGIGLDTLAKRMKISMRYLKDLEKCQFDLIPFAPIYKRNLIKNYAKTLGLDPTPYLDQYKIEETPQTENDFSPPTQKGLGSTLNIPSIARIFSLLLIIGSVLCYIGFQIKNIVDPPLLSIVSPREGLMTTSPQTSIKGITEKEIRIFINGNEIKTDESGNFEQLLDLQLGVNTIIVTAEKKHGKTTSETRHVTYKPTEENNPLSP